jgi:hypothetical protein
VYVGKAILVPGVKPMIPLVLDESMAIVPDHDGGRRK